jgi:hypothetical protein
MVCPPPTPHQLTRRTCISIRHSSNGNSSRQQGISTTAVLAVQKQRAHQLVVGCCTGSAAMMTDNNARSGTYSVGQVLLHTTCQSHSSRRWADLADGTLLLGIAYHSPISWDVGRLPVRSNSDRHQSASMQWRYTGHAVRRTPAAPCTAAHTERHAQRMPAVTSYAFNTLPEHQRRTA